MGRPGPNLGPMARPIQKWARAEPWAAGRAVGCGLFGDPGYYHGFTMIELLA